MRQEEHTKQDHSIIRLFLGAQSESIYITDFSLHRRIPPFFTDLSIDTASTEDFYPFDQGLLFYISLFSVFASLIAQKGASTYYFPSLYNPFNTLSCGISAKIELSQCSILSRGLRKQSTIFNLRNSLNATILSDFYMQLQARFSLAKFLYLRTWTVYESGIRLLDRSSYCRAVRTGRDFNSNSSQSARIKFCNWVNPCSSQADSKVRMPMR